MDHYCEGDCVGEKMVPPDGGFFIYNISALESVGRRKESVHSWSGGIVPSYRMWIKYELITTGMTKAE